ncbi:MAG TPA: SRPBCC family protein [Candidatus Angelobacter sp.]|jgi:aromatase|nr:SRPBCC family protein [Candidatus Angelobacter sp.]
MKSVTDTIRIAAPLDKVYDCCWNAEIWPRITSHVRQIDLLDTGKDRQRIRMVVENDGKLYTVESIRSAIPGSLITYQQTKLPEFLSEHSGEWHFSFAGAETSVQLTHRFKAKEEVARRILGLAENADVDAYVGQRLKQNGLLTLNAVKRTLEQTDQIQ